MWVYNDKEGCDSKCINFKCAPCWFYSYFMIDLGTKIYIIVDVKKYGVLRVPWKTNPKMSILLNQSLYCSKEPKGGLSH